MKTSILFCLMLTSLSSYALCPLNVIRRGNVPLPSAALVAKKGYEIKEIADQKPLPQGIVYTQSSSPQGGALFGEIFIDGVSVTGRWDSYSENQQKLSDTVFGPMPHCSALYPSTDLPIVEAQVFNGTDGEGNECSLKVSYEFNETDDSGHVSETSKQSKRKRILEYVLKFRQSENFSITDAYQFYSEGGEFDYTVNGIGHDLKISIVEIKQNVLSNKQVLSNNVSKFTQTADLKFTMVNGSLNSASVTSQGKWENRSNMEFKTEEERIRARKKGTYSDSKVCHFE